MLLLLFGVQIECVNCKKETKYNHQIWFVMKGGAKGNQGIMPIQGPMFQVTTKLLQEPSCSWEHVCHVFHCVNT